MKHIVAFGKFWYDFVIGDDWRVAVTVVAALGVAALLAHNGVRWAAWVLLPLAVVGALAMSLWRATRADRASARPR